MDYTGRKIYFWDPFWWFFLDKDPVGNPKVKMGVYDRKNPSKDIQPGEIILWEAHYGPNEGGVPLERLQDNPDFSEIKTFKPIQPFKILGEHDYEIHIFERLEDHKIREMQAYLEEVQKLGNSADGIRMLEYKDCELAAHEHDTANIGGLPSKSLSPSFLLNEKHAFLPGIEMPIEEISPTRNTKFIVKITHLFASLKSDRDPLFLVMSLQNAGKMIFYHTWDIKPQNMQTWEETILTYEIPKWRANSDMVKIYLWNKGGHRVYIDDFVIAITEPRE